MLAAPCIPVAFATFVVRERETKSKQQQVTSYALQLMRTEISIFLIYHTSAKIDGLWSIDSSLLAINVDMGCDVLSANCMAPCHAYRRIS